MGGPATTVMWKINGDPVREDSNHETSQIIVDTSENATYKNILRVRGAVGGRYTCNISNNIRDFFSDYRKSVINTLLVKGIQ